MKSAAIGRIDVMPNFSFFEADKSDTDAILQKVNGTDYEGHRLMVEVTQNKPEVERERSSGGAPRSGGFRSGGGDRGGFRKEGGGGGGFRKEGGFSGRRDSSYGKEGGSSPRSSSGSGERRSGSQCCWW